MKYDVTLKVRNFRSIKNLAKAESYVIKAKSLQADADSKKYNVHKGLA